MSGKDNVCTSKEPEDQKEGRKERKKERKEKKKKNHDACARVHGGDGKVGQGE